MSLRVLDLFAGCGGLSAGFKEAGFEICAANEVDKWAADTFTHNNPSIEMIQEDIRNIPESFWESRFSKKIDIVIGGPPCQGFSVSGRRQYGEIRPTNSLVSDYLKVVKIVQPDFVVMENVRGFKTGSISKDKKVLDYVTTTLELLGYNVYHKLLNAEDYGVPSLRSRIFIIASKFKFKKSPFPAPSHFREKNLSSSNAYTHVSCLDAISDLPELQACEGSEDMQKYAHPPLNPYQRRMRQGSNGVFNHVAMKHTARVVERFKLIQQGESSYRHSKQIEGAEKIKYKMNNQRLVQTKPSLCITANFQSNFIHPLQHRNLTAREAARLMSFPDSYVFQGKRTQMSSKFLKKYGREHEDFLSQYNQIGNSVPPLLSESVANSLLETILAGEGNYQQSFEKQQSSLEF
ncbi:MAG: DNA (cytosine-5)-methyltransferase 1 [Alcanivorax sp.]|jgi:DNA (cytosine-5)-methyltransferase 1|uniref:DNA cytosine methyltransferase n=1 Tax=Alcanivorax sp. TaxID=1872427 RepID=UPI0039E231E3